MQDIPSTTSKGRANRRDEPCLFQKVVANMLVLIAVWLFALGVLKRTQKGGDAFITFGPRITSLQCLHFIIRSRFSQRHKERQSYAQDQGPERKRAMSLVSESHPCQYAGPYFRSCFT